MQTLRCPRKLTILSKLIVLSALTGLAPAGAAEPLMPVSNQQCEQLQREASKARIAISVQARQCATDSQDRKWGVIGKGGCAAWVPRECASIVRQCEDWQARAEVSVASCREKVADLRDQLKDKAREAAIDAADARVGGGVRTVTNTLDKYQHTRDSAQAALDFFGGKQTPTEQYGAVSDLARGLHGAGAGSPVAREFFDRSLTEINTVHAAALQQLDATIAAIQGISPSPPRAAPPVFAARPDPALRAREAALRNEITTNSQRLEQQQ